MPFSCLGRGRGCLVIGWVAAVLLLSCNTALGQPGSKKLPVPDKKARDRAAALIEELFQEDLAKAKGNASARLKLAQTFLFEAKDTRDDPAGKYLLLQQSAALAAKAGDSATALQALDELTLVFDIPASTVVPLRMEALHSANEAAATPDALRDILDTALALADDATVDGDFEHAIAYGAIAEQAARRLKNVPLVSGIRKRNDEIKAAQAEYAQVKPFVDKLRQDSADAKANLEVGSYFALAKGNWERGLPLLAKGSDAGLKELAALELANSLKAEQLSELGAKWAKRAGSQSPADVNALQHAYSIYRRALGTAGISDKQQAAIQSAMVTINSQLPAEQRLGEIAVELRRFGGHSGPVYGVSISSDGSKVASAGSDGTVRLWDAKTGNELRRFSGHSGPVWTVQLSPDGRRILSGGFDKSIRLWSPVTGRESRFLSGHGDYVRSVAFSSEGRLILSGGDDRLIKLWSTDSAAEIATASGHDHFVFSVAISRDGKRGLSASLDRTVRLWDLENGKMLRTLSGHTDTVLSVVFTPDEKRALTASTDKTLRLWDLATGKTVNVFEGHKSFVQAVAITPDGQRALSAGHDGKVLVWDVEHGKLLRTLTGHSGPVWAVAVSADGRFAATAGEDGTVRLWGMAK